MATGVHAYATLSSCARARIHARAPITQEREPQRRDHRREAEVKPPLTPPLFEHFDWWSPLLQPGVHYLPGDGVLQHAAHTARSDTPQPRCDNVGRIH